MTTDRDKNNYAYVAGMIVGWKIRLEEICKSVTDQKEFTRVMHDMQNTSNKMAKIGGVTLKI